MAAKFISHVIAILGAVMIVSLALTIVTFPVALIWTGQPPGKVAITMADAFATVFSLAYFAAFRSPWPNSGRAVADHTESGEERVRKLGLQDDEEEAEALACSYVGCLAVFHNSDRDVAAVRAFKRALVLIWTVGLNARKPHVRAALGAPRVEDALRYNLRLTHRVSHRWPSSPGRPARSAQRGS